MASFLHGGKTSSKQPNINLSIGLTNNVEESSFLEYKQDDDKDKLFKRMEIIEDSIGDLQDQVVDILYLLKMSHVMSLSKKTVCIDCESSRTSYYYMDGYSVIGQCKDCYEKGDLYEFELINI